ncbi:DUF4870 domain-containing protein [Schleiferilactobacillus perolens]|uniref:Integral membrane protein n=1 Tax=Schleiferilactobacillus perolens DSM 12744 TaxID=1423792 RepID=A0A0R1N5A2_9LACO|nr:DUF4870 domain-containing protein [Schleiferilactobacillus perolens]KRL11931.1 hypothetical protein FD09_GL000539 [Schleiferilactobacillus perolens DSM 12744]
MVQNPEHDRIIDGLSYLSILFAPVLFPLIVWLISAHGSMTRYHARRALFLHLVPILMLFFGTAMFMPLALFSFPGPGSSAGAWIGIPIMIAAIVVDLGLVIYNIVLGVRILMGNDQ